MTKDYDTRLDEKDAEIERLREVIARCYMRMQCADVPREPWHWEVCTTLDNTGIPSSHEPSGCPEHGMEHFFEGMCIKCGVVPAVKSREPIICDRCGQDIAGKMVHECDGIL